jgi:hypothetical protein
MGLLGESVHVFQVLGDPRGDGLGVVVTRVVDEKRGDGDVFAGFRIALSAASMAGRALTRQGRILRSGP